MKFCNKCGNIHNDNSNFCSICGSSLNENATNVTTETTNADAFILDRNQNLRKYVLAIVLYFCAFYIFSAVFQTIYTFIWFSVNNYTVEDLENPVVYDLFFVDALSWSNFATYIAATLVIIPLLFNTIKKDVISYFNNLSFSLQWTGIGFGILYLGVIVGNIIVLALTYGLDASGNSENQEAINKIMQSGGLNLFLIAIITIVIAPIIEELIFRKALFGLFKKNTIMTVIFSAVIFASIHVIPACITLLIDVLNNSGSITDLYVEAVYIFSYLGQGVALSYVYYKTNGNIIPCIIIHLANNLIAFIVNLGI